MRRLNIKVLMPVEVVVVEDHNGMYVGTVVAPRPEDVESKLRNLGLKSFDNVQDWWKQVQLLISQG